MTRLVERIKRSYIYEHLIYIFAFCVLTFSIIGNANAQVPNKISYQGLLTTSAGAPVQDGSYVKNFDFYLDITSSEVGVLAR